MEALRPRERPILGMNPSAQERIHPCGSRDKRRRAEAVPTDLIPLQRRHWHRRLTFSDSADRATADRATARLIPLQQRRCLVTASHVLPRDCQSANLTDRDCVFPPWR
eukprot:3469094-Pyramimonas_sp.AAC.1